MKKPSALELEAARSSLLAWCRLCRPDFKITPARMEIIRACEDIEAGRQTRTMVSAAPGIGKSWIISEAFPSWALGRNPDSEFMVVSAASPLAESFSRNARRFLERWGKQVFGVELSEESRAVDSWSLKGREGRIHFIGASGSVVGRHCEIAIYDDLVKSQATAFSDALMEELWSTFQKDLMTRLTLDPPGRVLMVGTRWSPSDVMGRLVEEEATGGKRWNKVFLPAYPNGEYTLEDVPENMILAPFTRELLLDKRTEVGSQAFGAQYLCSPVDPEGSLLKRVWFKRWPTIPPKFDKIVIAVDPTQGKTGARNDYVVAAVYGRVGAVVHLIEQHRAKESLLQTVDVLLALRARYPTARIEIEDSANGSSLHALLKGRVPNMYLHKVKGSKEERVRRHMGRLEAGQVLFPPSSVAPWVEQLEDEFAAFPAGAHDDQVDAWTIAMDCLPADGTLSYYGGDARFWDTPTLVHSAGGGGYDAGRRAMSDRPDHREDDRRSSSRLGGGGWIGL
jgi:predicted phage terminase large subunit-like protein